MSNEKYPALTAKHVVNILNKAGFSFVRQSGSHAIYEKTVDGKIHLVVVPVHAKKDLKPKTLKSIISQSGMTKKEFYGHLSFIAILFGGFSKLISFGSLVR